MGQAKTGGEDSLFICNDCSAAGAIPPVWSWDPNIFGNFLIYLFLFLFSCFVGVADGVGEWSNFGLSTRDLADDLMHEAKQICGNGADQP